MIEAFDRVDRAIMPIVDRLTDFPSWNYYLTLQRYLSDVRFSCVQLPPRRDRLLITGTFSGSEVWVRDILFLGRHLEEEAAHFYSAGEDTVALQHAIGWLPNSKRSLLTQ